MCITTHTSHHKITAFFSTDQRISPIKYYKHQIMIILQCGDYHFPRQNTIAIKSIQTKQTPKNLLKKRTRYYILKIYPYYQSLSKIVLYSKLVLVNEDLLKGCNIILLVEHQHRFLVIN